MSKASQRKEAEKRKRLAKQGVNLALMKEFRRKGPAAFSDPQMFWKYTTTNRIHGEQYDKFIHHADRERLERVLKEVCSDSPISSFVEATVLVEADVSMPGVLFLRHLDGDPFEEGPALPLDVQGFEWDLAAKGPTPVCSRLFELCDHKMQQRAGGQQCDAIVWAFGLYLDGDPTICLACSRSGAVAGRVLVQGSWIDATYPWQLWTTVAHEVGRLAANETWVSSTMASLVEMARNVDRINADRLQRGIEPASSLFDDEQGQLAFFSAASECLVDAQLDYMQLAIDVAESTVSEIVRFDLEDEYEERLEKANKELMQLRQAQDSLRTQLEAERQRTSALRADLANTSRTSAGLTSGVSRRSIVTRFSDYFAG